MNQKKSLQELTFKDNFMFGAVLLDPENCKGVIERSIGTEIERVEVAEELVKFLTFVGANLSEREKDYQDAFVKRLQESIRDVKVSREMGARHMTFQELLKDEREMGRAEGRTEGEYNKLVSQIQKKLVKGQTVAQIADELEEDTRTIQNIIDEMASLSETNK